MANYWAEHGREVALITLSGPESDWYPLNPRVTRVALGEARPSAYAAAAFWNNLRRVVRLRQALRISGAKAVISFIDTMNVLTLLATRGLDMTVVVSERVAPQAHRLRGVWAGLRRLSYRWADTLVVQTSAIANWAKHHLKTKRIATIPNPVRMRDGPTAGATLARPLIVAMGRLERQKGFDLLLHAVSKLFADYPDWSLVILGEGSERSNIEHLARELGLAGRVQLPGLHPKPTRVFEEASLFVLSSRYEGFPNTLCEAMAYGLPVVAFDCPTGPGEIIRDGVDGVLVPPENVDALAAALRALISDPDRRLSLSARAIEVSERFGVDRVMATWDDLIDQLRAR